LHHGHVLAVLAGLPAASVHCVVTSPPYWGLRDYGLEPQVWPDGWRGSLGLEPTPELYVAHLVEVFRAVRRVLRKDGTLWLNLGDNYAGAPPGNARPDHSGPRFLGTRDGQKMSKTARAAAGREFAPLKPKDLVLMPARVALALQADGWWLRADIVWAKLNPMPESVTDRPTRSHEYLFLLARSERYYYDAEAIAEPLSAASLVRLSQPSFDDQRGGPKDYGPDANRSMRRGIEHLKRRRSGNKARDIPAADDGRGIPNDHRGRGIPWEDDGQGRNARTVWEIGTQPYLEAHFATFPEELARRCILAGSRPGDTVLDPFGGSGTVAQVATGHGRDALYIDLNPAYLELARQRIGPLLCR
jgi:DNA modification methylase